MMILKLLTFLLLLVGLTILLSALLSRRYFYGSHRIFTKIKRRSKPKTDMWSAFPLQQLLALASKLTYLDEQTETTLQKQLNKAGISDTPREYTGKKYLIVFLGVTLSALCIPIQFYIGMVLTVLATVFFLLKLRDGITDKIQKKDAEIAEEMPRFVRTVCRNLQSDRDLVRVLQSYRKIAGTVLGAELDILLAEMQAGNIQNALSHFESRLGTAEAFRFCAALRDVAQGIDQTAVLSYLADSMTMQAKENLRKKLSLRPAKMRATYYPAVGVCVAMIMYVLVCYVMQSLNGIL